MRDERRLRRRAALRRDLRRRDHPRPSLQRWAPLQRRRMGTVSPQEPIRGPILRPPSASYPVTTIIMPAALQGRGQGQEQAQDPSALRRVNTSPRLTTLHCIGSNNSSSSKEPTRPTPAAAVRLDRVGGRSTLLLGRVRPRRALISTSTNMRTRPKAGHRPALPRLHLTPLEDPTAQGQREDIRHRPCCQASLFPPAGWLIRTRTRTRPVDSDLHPPRGPTPAQARPPGRGRRAPPPFPWTSTVSETRTECSETCPRPWLFLCLFLGSFPARIILHPLLLLDSFTHLLGRRLRVVATDLAPTQGVWT